MPRLGPFGLALLSAVVACAGGGGATGVSIPAGATLTVTVTGLTPLDAATEGRYQAWVLDRGGASSSLGTLDLRQSAPVTLTNPVADPAVFEITFEPRGDADGIPSGAVLLRGDFRGGRATLSVAGAVTQGALPLRDRPGQFTMFSPSDNAVHGYPSFEESGVWLFNMAPRDTPQNDMWLRLTQLRDGWTYEGWMVRDIDLPNAIWLSYGKFTPDVSGAVNRRDDTGWGAYSGVTNFRTAGEEEFPGDDWIANPLGLALPAGLTLPLNLREKNAQGQSRWTHLITVEPASDRGEEIGTERPFVIRPYRDAFGDGGPGVPRTITYRASGVPGGEVVAK
jgi:hypothetical protein